jgi:DNA-binding NarL/FixJ family response regulator
MSIVSRMNRVLVVEDFEPFRRFIISMLRERVDLQIVGEVFDGLEAVHKAEELQPDLILLDICLPQLNGLAAARRIRTLSPTSRIIFVSQESTADIVAEGLKLGAVGYIVKTRVGVDLPLAVDAALDGRQFVSNELLRHEFTPQRQPAVR